MPSAGRRDGTREMNRTIGTGDEGASPPDDGSAANDTVVGFDDDSIPEPAPDAMADATLDSTDATGSDAAGPDPDPLGPGAVETLLDGALDVSGTAWGCAWRVRDGEAVELAGTRRRGGPIPRGGRAGRAARADRPRAAGPTARAPTPSTASSGSRSGAPSRCS